MEGELVANFFISETKRDFDKCLIHLPIQKTFLPRSNFFEHVQYFLNTVKFFDHGQKQDFTL